VSYLEIYNEVVQDLLESDARKDERLKRRYCTRQSIFRAVREWPNVKYDPSKIIMI